MGAFDGLADVYENTRHGYPRALREHLIQIKALTGTTTVIDLGAGTGQLARLVADVAPLVTAIDPEPDMVRAGRRATEDWSGIRWLVGADRNLLDLVAAPIDLVVIGNAFHHMDRPRLLADLDELLSPTGALAICSSSVPVWLQDTRWSAALRSQLESELGRSIDDSGTPDHHADLAILAASPFAQVETWSHQRSTRRSGESIVGEVISSASGAIDSSAADRLCSTLAPFLDQGSLTEYVRTTALIARRAEPIVPVRHEDTPG